MEANPKTPVGMGYDERLGTDFMEKHLATIGSRDVTIQGLLPCSAVILLWARPSLLNQKGQVVYPIVFAYPARIDNVRQIVFGIRDNKIGVPN